MKNDFALEQGKVFIGSESNKAAAQTISKDATITFDGKLTISENAITSDKIKDGEVKTADIANANVTLGKIETLGDAEIIVGSTTGNNAVAMSGDVTMNNAGATKIGEGKVTTTEILDGTIATADIANEAVTNDKIADGTIAVSKISTSNTGSDGQLLAKDGDSFKWKNASDVQLSADNIALAENYILIGNSDGKAESKVMKGDATLVADGTITVADGAITSAKIKDGEVKTADIADAAITNTKLSDQGETNEILSVDADGNLKWVKASEMETSFSLTKNQIFVGNASDKAAAVDMTGDATIVADGTITIADGAINSDKIKDGEVKTADIADANVTTDKIKDANVTLGKIETLGDAKIIVGTTTGNTAVAMSGDVTMDNAGATKIGEGKVTTTEILDGTIKNEDLNKSDIPLSGFAAAEDNVSMGGNALTNVATPTLGTDAANKSYVDGINTDLTNQVNALKVDNHAIPYWDGTKYANSSMWSDGTHVKYSASAPDSYTYAFQVDGEFKTNKIYHSSDARWKQNITTIDSALAKVEQLRGVTYEWRTEEFPEKNFSKGTQVGLIAQEVEAVIPELVTTDNSGYKAVEYANLVAVLIEAVKEQQAMINAQAAEIESLKASNADMTAQIERMNNLESQVKLMQNQLEAFAQMMNMLNVSASK